jgi:hypothetical protein
MWYSIKRVYLGKHFLFFIRPIYTSILWKTEITIYRGAKFYIVHTYIQIKMNYIYKQYNM